MKLSSHLEQLQTSLAQKFPDTARDFKFHSTQGDDVIEMPKEHVIPTLRHFKQNGDFNF